MGEQDGKAEGGRKQRALHEKLRESFELLFLGHGRSGSDAYRMAQIAVGEDVPVELPDDLRKSAMLNARIRERFRKMFLRDGETEADAAAMADVAVRD